MFMQVMRKQKFFQAPIIITIVGKIRKKNHGQKELHNEEDGRKPGYDPDHWRNCCAVCDARHWA